jgi:hypothetical protein
LTAHVPKSSAPATEYTDSEVSIRAAHGNKISTEANEGNEESGFGSETSFPSFSSVQNPGYLPIRNRDGKISGKVGDSDGLQRKEETT